MSDACATRDEIILVGGDSYDEPPTGTVPLGVFSFYMDLACELVGDCYGDRKSYAHTLLTLHLLTVWQNDGGETGPVTSRKIDKIQATYSAGSTAGSGDPHLALTRWGRMYQAVDAARVPMPFAVRTRLGSGGGGCGC